MPSFPRPKPRRRADSPPASCWFDRRQCRETRTRRRTSLPTRRSLVVLAATITLVTTAPARAQDKSIVVASTTSTQDSGLFGRILPLFKAKTGIVVKVVAQGTGQALDTARRGDADVFSCTPGRQRRNSLRKGLALSAIP